MMSRVAGVALVALTSVLGAGCNRTPDEGASRDAQIYMATIRDVLSQQPAPADPKVLPVVYVVAVGETKIPADVQAQVAAALDDDADIRFADKRSEAVLGDVEHVPVRDGGLLVAFGELPADSDPAHIEVEVYRSDQDSSKVVLTIARRSSQWTVTSWSSVPAVDS